MENKEALNTLNEIKDIMQKSTRFQSISGSSIIVVGVLASIVAAGAWALLLPHPEIAWLPACCNGILINSPHRTLIAAICALALLVIAFFTVSAASFRKIKQQKGTFTFDQTIRRPLFHFCVPMVAGGLLCIAMLTQGHYGLTSTFMLSFYGLALLNASHHTHRAIALLGYGELALGVADCFAVNHAVLFWWLGFGLLHILFGIYFKRNTSAS